MCNLSRLIFGFIESLKSTGYCLSDLGLTHMLHTLWSKGIIRMIAVTFVSLVFIHNALGALPVIDSSVLSESIRQRSLMLNQWAKDNEYQLKQINELITSNKQFLITHNMMEQNYTMDYQSSWKDVSHMQEQSLALLYATKSLWGEYGSAQRYYADHLKAQAWENCMETQNCNFNQALQEMNDLNMSHALQAYENAEKVNEQLEQQISALQQISLEGLNSQSLAATIDAMAKINGSIAVSMGKLNQQLALFTQMIGQDMAKQSATEEMDRQYRQQILEHTPLHQTPISTLLQ